MSINVEFSGGLETIFHYKRRLPLTLPGTGSDGTPYTIGHLIQHLADTYAEQSKRDLFQLEDGVRPGILVLVNDVDWELEGEAAYVLRSGDEVVFVSTLHGG